MQDLQLEKKKVIMRIPDLTFLIFVAFIVNSWFELVCNYVLYQL